MPRHTVYVSSRPALRQPPFSLCYTADNTRHCNMMLMPDAMLLRCHAFAHNTLLMLLPVISPCHFDAAPRRRHGHDAFSRHSRRVSPYRDDALSVSANMPQLRRCCCFDFIDTTATRSAVTRHITRQNTPHGTPAGRRTPFAAAHTIHIRMGHGIPGCHAHVVDAAATTLVYCC